MTTVSRILFAHGDAPCRACGLPLDPADAEYIHLFGEERARGAIGRCRRCGAGYAVDLLDLPE